MVQKKIELLIGFIESGGHATFDWTEGQYLSFRNDFLRIGHVMNSWQISSGRMGIVVKNVDIPTIARE